MITNMNCSHHLWVNTRPEHAFFVEHDFEVERHPFRAHPDPSEPIPGKQWLSGGVPRYWMFQVPFSLDLPCMLGLHFQGSGEPQHFSSGREAASAEVQLAGLRWVVLGHVRASGCSGCRVWTFNAGKQWLSGGGPRYWMFQVRFSLTPGTAAALQ